MQQSVKVKNYTSRHCSTQCQRHNLLDSWFFIKSCLLHFFINFIINHIMDFFETCLFFLVQTEMQHVQHYTMNTTFITAQQTKMGIQ